MEIVRSNQDTPAGAGPTLPAGWTEVWPGGLATNPDPLLGGIIDRADVSGLWFVIFSRIDLPVLDGLASRDLAFDAFYATLRAAAGPAADA